jgi:hypothetical protein
MGRVSMGSMVDKARSLAAQIHTSGANKSVGVTSAIDAPSTTASTDGGKVRALEARSKHIPQW